MLRQVFQAVAYAHTHDILHVRVPRHSCCRYRRDFPRACVGEEVNVAVLLPNVPASIVVAPDFGRLQMSMRQRQATQRGTVCIIASVKAPELNGATGTCVGGVCDSDRWAVRLQVGGVNVWASPDTHPHQ